MMAAEERKLITAAEVEAKTTITRSTLWSWRSRRKVGVPLGFKLAGRLVYDEDEVEAWVAAQRKAGRSE